MSETKLIGKGAFSCAFMPGYDCKGKPVNDKVTKVTAEKYQSKNEYLLGKLIKTIPNYEAYLQTLQRVNFSYRIGVVQGGDWQEPIYLATDPNFKGYVVFLLNPDPPLK